MLDDLTESSLRELLPLLWLTVGRCRLRHGKDRGLLLLAHDPCPLELPEKAI